MKVTEGTSEMGLRILEMKGGDGEIRRECQPLPDPDTTTIWVELSLLTLTEENIGRNKGYKCTNFETNGESDLDKVRKSRNSFKVHLICIDGDEPPFKALTGCRIISDPRDMSFIVGDVEQNPAYEDVGKDSLGELH